MKLKEKLVAFKKATTMREITELITENDMEWLAFLILLPFLLSPVISIIPALFGLGEGGFLVFSYGVVMDFVHSVSYFLFVFYLLVYVSKIKESDNVRISSVIKSNLLLIIWISLMIWMVISTVVNGRADTVLHGDGYRKESLLTSLSYFFLYFFIATQITGEKLRSLIYQIIMWGSVPVCLFGFFHLLHNRELFDEDLSIHGITGVFFQNNHYGYYLAVVSILCVCWSIWQNNRRQRIIGFVLVSMNFFAFAWNGCFGSWLGTLFVLVVIIAYEWIQNRKFPKVAVSLLGMMILMALVTAPWNAGILNDFLRFFGDVELVTTDSKTAGSAGTGRWTLWKKSAQYISERPVFGWGLEGAMDRLELETGSTRPHNEFLQYGVFYGIPGMFLYIVGILIWLKAVLIKGIKTRSFTVLIPAAAAGAYLGSSFFGNTMFYTAPFLFILLGLSYSKKEYVKK